MSTSNPLRLDAAFVQQARATARLYKRSVPRQIEYWAELGRAVESLLSQEQLIAVQEGLARIVIEQVSSEPVSPDEVFAEAEQQRRSRDLGARVTNAPVRYQRSQSHPGHLGRIASGGTRTVGVFRGGRFVPVEP